LREDAAVREARLEHVRVVPRRRHGAGSRLWAEWCFVRACFRHFRLRFLLMLAILLSGALLFILFEPERKHSLAQATYYTFALVFGEPPEAFPRSRVLQAVFFLVPLLGLTVIIEGIVDFALMLRDRRRYEKSWCTMLAMSFRNHVVLVGFGRLGFRTFLVLRKLGEAVVVIERDAANQFLEEVRRDGSPILIGDARREALLEDANIREARSIILATDDDMANLETAMDARRVNPGIRVVLRMFDQNIADKVREGLNIPLAMSQSSLSAPTFATCAVAPATINSFVLGDELIAMQRWLVRRDEPLSGKTVGDVMREFHVVLVAHQAPGEVERLAPPPETVLNPGDGIVVQGPVDVLELLRSEFISPAAIEKHLRQRKPVS
jgi:Trk K+ transport system NAD-binding subunit